MVRNGRPQPTASACNLISFAFPLKVFPVYAFSLASDRLLILRNPALSFGMAADLPQSVPKPAEQ